MRQRVTFVDRNSVRHTVARVHHHARRAGDTNSNEGWCEALRNPRMWELCAAQSRKSPSRDPSCVSNRDSTARIATLMAGTLNVANMICWKVLRESGRSSNPHRIPLHWWRHHLKSIVGANAVNSLVMTVVRHGAHRDKASWFATFMASTLRVSNMICVMRSWTGFVVHSLRGHNLLEGIEGRQEERILQLHNEEPSHWWIHHLDFIAEGANAVSSLVLHSPIPRSMVTWYSGKTYRGFCCPPYHRTWAGTTLLGSGHAHRRR